MDIPASGYFVTGTDTGVGKTLVACGLLHELGRRGLRVVGMKPVAAGCRTTPQGLRNDDAERLLAAGVLDVPYPRVNHYAFEEAIAPHIAARDMGVEIAIDGIRAAFRALAAEAECVIVEGIGGFEVPLGEVETGADLAVALDLPVILVVGMRLGCLNHALLTHQAIRARGLPCAGWVANGIDPHMARLQENIDSLRLRLDAPLLGVLPSLPTTEPAAAAGYLELGPLLQGRF